MNRRLTAADVNAGDEVLVAGRYRTVELAAKVDGTIIIISRLGDQTRTTLYAPGAVIRRRPNQRTPTP